MTALRRARLIGIRLRRGKKSRKSPGAKGKGASDERSDAWEEIEEKEAVEEIRTSREPVSCGLGLFRAA